MLTQRKIIIIILLVIVTIVILSIIVFNLTFFKKIQNIEHAKVACAQLPEGDQCTYPRDNKTIKGTCTRVRSGILVCRPS